MILSEIKEWILVLSGSATMLSVAIGIWLSLREYRLKLRAEQRQERSSAIEAEIRLHKLFTDLMGVANGRSGYKISEKAVEFVLAHFNTAEWKKDPQSLNQAIEDVSILTLPVGSAEQDASIAAIASLTKKYPELRVTGMRALDSLVKDVRSQVAQYYFEETVAALEKEGIDVQGLIMPSTRPANAGPGG